MLEAKVRFVSVLIFSVRPEDFDGISREAATLVKRKGPAIRGLVESIVLTNQDKTQMLLVSQWTNRESWRSAQWDDDMGRTLTSFIESATAFEVHSYEPIAIVRPEAAG